MAADEPFAAALRDALKAISVSFKRPKAKSPAIAPLLWIIDLGTFRAWSGPRPWDLCFGKDSSCLEDPDAPTQTACAEVIVARRMVETHYTAGWLSTFRTSPPASWVPRLTHEVARAVVQPVFPRVAEMIGVSGTPDVFAYRGDNDFLFVEVKRDPDRLNIEQVAWFEAALAAGVPASRLFVAEWATERD